MEYTFYTGVRSFHGKTTFYYDHMNNLISQNYESPNNYDSWYHFTLIDTYGNKKGIRGVIKEVFYNYPPNLITAKLSLELGSQDSAIILASHTFKEGQNYFVNPITLEDPYKKFEKEFSSCRPAALRSRAPGRDPVGFATSTGAPVTNRRSGW